MKIGRKITGASAETMRTTAEVALNDPRLAGSISLQTDLANMLLDLLDASTAEEINRQLNDMYYHLIPERRQKVDDATFNKFYNPSPE